MCLPCTTQTSSLPVSLPAGKRIAIPSLVLTNANRGRGGTADRASPLATEDEEPGSLSGRGSSCRIRFPESFPTSPRRTAAAPASAPASATTSAGCHRPSAVDSAGLAHRRFASVETPRRPETPGVRRRVEAPQRRVEAPERGAHGAVPVSGAPAGRDGRDVATSRGSAACWRSTCARSAILISALRDRSPSRAFSSSRRASSGSTHALMCWLGFRSHDSKRRAHQSRGLQR
jgi:hypothetical protein